MPTKKATGKRGGQPPGSGPKYCPETVKTICANLEIAMPIGFAAEAAGVSRITVHEWIRKKPEFALQVSRARAKAVQMLTLRALAGEKGSMQATWFLERRYADDYGAKQAIELSGKDGAPIQVEAIAQKLDQLTVEELKALAQ